MLRDIVCKFLYRVIVRNSTMSDSPKVRFFDLNAVKVEKLADAVSIRFFAERLHTASENRLIPLTPYSSVLLLKRMLTSGYETQVGKRRN
jgi:hypothetical protein